MKKIFYVTILILIGFTSWAQVPTIQWQKTLGGSGWDLAKSIQQTRDGGYILTGYTTSSDGDVMGYSGGGDVWVVKLTSIGNIQWSYTLGGTEYDYAYSIRQTPDDGFILVSQSRSNNGHASGNHGRHDFWVVKLRANGTIQWQKSLGGTREDIGKSVEPTADGGYIVCGYTESNDGDVINNTSLGGAGHYWVVKLNSAGNIQWQKTYGGSEYDAPSAIKQTTDGGYILAGFTNSNNGHVSGNHGYYDCWLLKISSIGDIEWQKCYGGSQNDRAYSVQQTSDGGYIFAGLTESFDGDITLNRGNGDYWIVKTNNTGTIEWQKTYGGSATLGDIAESIHQTADGGYIVNGQSGSTNHDVTGNHGFKDFWVIRLNSAGTLLWQKSLGGSGSDEGSGIQQTTDGGYIAVGNTQSYNGDVTGNHGGIGDIWVVKLSSGDLGLADIAAENSNFVYPNPAKDKIYFKEEINAVAIFDLKGTLIQTVTAPMNFLDVSMLPKGSYILKIDTASNKFQTKFLKE